MAESKVPTVRLESPEGRLVNHSLFEKDTYKDERGVEAIPSYKVELAIDPDAEGFKEFDEALAQLCVDFWGEGADQEYWDGDILGLRSGDDIAATRDEKGKPSDAYRGNLVLRTSTVFNADGQDAPGGVYVCDENAEAVDFAGRGKVYNGCFGKVVVTAKPYQIKKGNKVDRGIKLYLNGFQYVKDGERLRTSDPSTLFKPLKAAGKGESRGRRGR